MRTAGGRLRLVVAAFLAVSAGCSSRHGAGPVDCTGGYATDGGCVLASEMTGGQVAARVEGEPLPPMNAAHLTHVRCRVARHHTSAVCRARVDPASGPIQWVTLRFRITSEEDLIPDCRHRPANVLCAN
jgi:hypothetical protein